MKYFRQFEEYLTPKRAVLSLCLVGFLLYFNALFNAFVWDDEEQILNNSIAHSISNFPSFFLGSTFNTGGSGSLGGLYYKPMMTVFFSFLYTVFGPNPTPFHLFQIALHITNSILIFFLFKHLFDPKRESKSSLLAFVLSLIFLTHPINTEAAIYSASLQDVLFFFFGMWAFLILVKSKLNFMKVFYISLLLLLSFLSKETGLVFIPIIGIYLLLFRGKAVISYVISLALSLSVYSLLRFGVAGVFFRKHSLSPITRASLDQRLLTTPKIFYSYIKTFFYPNDLAISQHWIVRTLNFTDFYLPILVGLLTLIYLGGQALYLYQKSKQYFKLHLLFASWFLLGILAHLQIVPLDMTVAERWFYLPVAGLIGVFGISLRLIYDKASSSSKKNLLKLSLPLGAILLTLLSIRSFVRTFDWRDGLTLYGHDIQISKDAFDLENNYGVALYRAGKIEESKPYFERSTVLAPYWWTNWNNLGAVLEQEHKSDEAKIDYQKSIDNGQYYLAYENMASVLSKEDPKKAKAFCEDSLKKLPYNGKLWMILSIVDYQLKDKDGALQAAYNSFQLSPNNQTYYLYSTLKSGQDLKLQ